MYQLRQQLCAFNHAWTRSREIRVRINSVDTTISHGRQIVEWRIAVAEDAPDLLHRLLQVEATGHDDQNFRRPRYDFFPRDSHRLTSLAAELVNAAGELHQLGHPVTTRINRIEPLHAEHARPARD